MPEICRFYGIIIRMYFADHAPPHFHAQYGDEQVVVDIRTLAVLRGRLPPRATGMLMEWAWMRQQELLNLWNDAQESKPLYRLEPLA